MRGRKKQPTELKLLRLSSARAEKLARTITPTSGPLAEAPDWLSAEQKLEWAYILEHAPKDVLKKIDRGVVACYAVAVDTFKRAADAANKTHLLVRSPTQQLPLQNPYLPIQNKQARLIKDLAVELGFTPCSRARIDSGLPPQISPAGDWEDVG